jgi:Nif-specific regulatory protein
VLEVLAKHHGTVRSMVTLLQDNGELHVEASDGLDQSPHTIRYRLGEGIIGKVVQSSKPVVVPRVSREPTFLSRAARRPELPKEELSFICVPICSTAGPSARWASTSSSRPIATTTAASSSTGIVASSIAQAVKIQRLIEEDKKKLVDENTQLRQELKERYDFSSIIGSSGPVRQMYEQMSQVAATNTTVLIRGESGTGKEMVAHAIHYNSPRANKPFVKVSCAALPDSLIESELFGYEKGAFTGAEQRKKGRFELAEGGTLFLDEIGDINLTTQVKLLRVLQEREFERLGSTETVKVNVRLIAATHKDMERAIAAGTFREDLYYRLNVFAIFVPPLRERKADLLLLVDHFLEKFSHEHKKEHQADLDAGHRHAHELPLAGQRPRAGEHAGTRGPHVRQPGGPRPSPAALAADGRSVWHRHARLSERRGRRLREGPHPGCVEDDARQPREGGAAARHNRARAELQGPQVHHRRPPVYGLVSKHSPQRPGNAA